MIIARTPPTGGERGSRATGPQRSNTDPKTTTELNPHRLSRQARAPGGLLDTADYRPSERRIQILNARAADFARAESLKAAKSAMRACSAEDKAELREQSRVLLAWARRLSGEVR